MLILDDKPKTFPENKTHRPHPVLQIQQDTCFPRSSIIRRNNYYQIHPQVNNVHVHNARVGALAWNGEMLSSGSRDRMIIQRDIRTPMIVPQRKLSAHRQEVCGLKWSPDNQYLASGGNDNRLYVWNLHSITPVQTYTEHVAAVKAIAWSPHHHGLLASGGGTADRCIRFWNTLTGQPMQSVDTGSQVGFSTCLFRIF